MSRQTQGGSALPAGPLWYTANEILAFLLELTALGLLGWWGFATGGDTLVRLLLGIGTPAVAVALWGLFAAPRARFRPPLPGVLLVKAVVLGGGAAALYGVGHRVAAVALLAVVIVNTAVAETSRGVVRGGVQETYLSYAMTSPASAPPPARRPGSSASSPATAAKDSHAELSAPGRLFP